MRRAPLWWSGGPGTAFLEAEQPHFLPPLTGEEMDSVDEAHPVAPGAHQQRVRPRAVGEEANAAQEVAVRHTRRGHDHLTRCEVFRGVDPRVVLDPDLAQLVDLAARRRPELRL